jgi:hypothetical protein
VWGNIEGKIHTSNNRKQDWNLDVIIQNMNDEKSEHWSPNLYKNLYSIWNIFGFKMMHLDKLSEFFDYKIEYKPELYDSHKMKHFKSKVEILSMISKDKLDELYILCDKDELWLKRILNNERGLTSYDLLMEKQNEIDKLEDDILNLKMKLKSIKSIKRELI